MSSPTSRPRLMAFMAFMAWRLTNTSRPSPHAAGSSHGRLPAALATAVALAIAIASATAVAAPPSTVPPFADPTAGLGEPVHAVWTGLPLAEWTASATALAGRPVLLDARLDPDRPITCDSNGETIGAVLEEVAASCDAAVELLASSIRFVPLAERGRLSGAERRRTGEVAALTPQRRRRATARAPWQWPAGARPRDLLADAAKTAGIDVVGLDAVPHDHLPGVSLPPLSLAERLDLVLASYELRAAWDGRTVRIVPLEPAEARPDADAPPPPRGTAGSRRPRPASQGVERFTLRLEAPLDAALRAVSARLGLTLELDRESLAARGVAPGEIVRAEVRDVTHEALLDAILDPPGLRWTITDGRLRVFAP